MPPCRLDEVVDAHQITSVLLDIMPKCSKSVQQGILELLPELVLEEDCEVTACPLRCKLSVCSVSACTQN